MKLFEMRGADAVDVMVDMADPVSRVIADKNAGTAIAKLTKLAGTGMPPLMVCPLALVAMKPLLKNHKEDMLRIAAALTGKSYEAVCDQPILATIKEVAHVWDADTRDFFTSSADTEHAE